MDKISSNLSNCKCAIQSSFEMTTTQALLKNNDDYVYNTVKDKMQEIKTES